MTRTLFCVFLFPTALAASTLSSSLPSDPTEPEALADTITLRAVSVASSLKEDGTALRHEALSTTRLGSLDLQRLDARNLKGIGAMAPNLFMPDYGSRQTSALYIRGIGSRIGTPAIGLYVDGVPYIDKSAFDFGLLEAESIEVLRGPQSTLYGTNTMGGVVRINTRSPLSYQGTDAQLDYATRENRYRAALTHYHRPSDRVAFSTGAFYEHSNGFYRHDITGNRLDKSTQAGGRIRIQWLGRNRWQGDAQMSYEHTHEGAYPYYYTGATSGKEDFAELQGYITPNHEGSYRRNLFTASLRADRRGNYLTFSSVTSYQHIADRMDMDQDFLWTDIYTLAQRQRIHTVTEEVTLRARRLGRWEWVSGAMLSHQWLDIEAPVTFHHDGVTWLAGVANQSMPQVSDIPAMAKMGFQQMSVAFKGEELAMGGTFKTPRSGAAIYHQSTLHLSDRLSATLGLRLDYEHHSLDYDAPYAVDYTFALPNPNPMMNVALNDLRAEGHYDGRCQKDELHLLPRLTLRYDFGHDLGNVYASASQGMRSGGYNAQLFSEILQGALRADMMQGVKDGVKDYMTSLAAKYPMMPPSVIGTVTSALDNNMPHMEHPDVSAADYKPEKSWNFEVGTHLNAGSSLQFDASLFVMLTRQQQIARFTPTGLGRIMVNAGKSRSLGGEVSARYLPSRHLSVVVNYGYTHATFTDYDGGEDTPGHTVDYNSNRIPFAPEHTMGLNGAYTWLPTASWLSRITLGVDAQGAGRIWWDEANRHSQSFYALLGARLEVANRYGSLSLWGKNLTQTRYNTFWFESVGRGFEQHGKPLQVGLTLRIHI